MKKFIDLCYAALILKSITNNIPLFSSFKKDNKKWIKIKHEGDEDFTKNIEWKKEKES